MSARRRTLRRACKALPSRTRSSSLRARESSSAICSSCKTSAHRTSRASAVLCEPGLRLRPASVESRFEALHASGLTELVGREEELELLLRRWSKAKSWRRPSGAPVRRSRHWQIAAYCGAYGTPRKRTAHAPALLLLSATHRQRALSDHRADGTGSGTSSRRYRTSEARQARCSARADLDLKAGCGIVRRDAVAAERRALSGARHGPTTAQAENAGSAHRAVGGIVASKPCADDLRGRALD